MDRPILVPCEILSRYHRRSRAMHRGHGPWCCDCADGPNENGAYDLKNDPWISS